MQTWRPRSPVHGNRGLEHWPTATDLFTLPRFGDGSPSPASISDSPCS